MSHSGMSDTSMGGMESNSTSSMDGMYMEMMMKAYLHFTPGDALLFSTIAPSSAGAVFGACVVLFLIAILERWLRAVGRGIEGRFRRRTTRLASYAFFNNSNSNPDSKEPSALANTPQVDVRNQTSDKNRFIFSHELTRGALAGLETTLHYLLMLVVMTFNAAYIIAVILGVVVGEVAFGRLNRGC
ncbi:Ctr copper transporter family-domain-containing protein [Mycena crocata]|nr:Ctr copper transporter family-domain-containing protein [Mycena crocata]